MEWGALVVLGIATFLGALVQTATGFGFAIIAAPVFLGVMRDPQAIPILVALHVVQSLMLVPSLWRKASRWHLKRLVLGAALGCPLGLWIFLGLDVRVLKLSAGVIIIAVIGLLVWREWLPPRRLRYAQSGKKSGTAVTLFTGLVCGAMTALLVMPGPPLMIYFLRERQAGEAVRALSLSFFALCYVAVTAAYIAAGGVTKPSWTTIGLLSPLVIAGTCAGALVSARLSERGLHAALMGLLALSGIGAIVSGFVG